MAKLSDVIAKAIKDVQPEINAGIDNAMAKSVGTTVVKPAGKVGAIKLDGIAQERVADLGFITKSLRGGALRDVDLSDLDARAKAVGVTADVAEILPDGFTGALLHDIQESLNVAKLFPMRTTKGGIAHDTIALYGITAYLTNEATTGTDSSEGYKTFVATTQNVLAVVRKSYQILDDSLIDIAMEVRSGIIRAIAEAVELAVVNGDIAGTQDGTTFAANSAARVCNGIRYHGLNKVTVDSSLVDYTAADGGEAQFLKLIDAMQIAGGVYLDEAQVAKGNVVMVLDQGTYGKIRQFASYKTMDKVGNIATLMGGKVKTIFDIPFVVTTQLPAVDVNGVIDSVTPANNVKTSMFMMNIDTLRLTANGNVIAESDKDITNQTFVYTGSLRFGFASVYDSTEAAINTVTADQKNVVAAINLAK
jgi:HK97 family phage major capsid protein